LDNSTLYLANYNGIKIINASNPLNLSEISSYNIYGFSKRVYFHNNYIFTIDDNDNVTSPGGMRIWDITNPSNPVIKSNFKRDTFLKEIDFYNNFAYLVYYDSLIILDISNVNSPAIVNSIPSPVFYHIVISNNYLYAFDFPNFKVYDISNPSNPNLIYSNYLPISYVFDAVANNNYIYAIVQYGTERFFYIIDISNPSSPFLASYKQILLPGNLSILNNRAYLSEGAYFYFYNGGLRIFDISNVNNVYQIGYYNTLFPAQSTYLFGDYVFIANGYGEISVINANNLNNISTVAYYRDSSFVSSVFFLNGYIFSANGIEGLSVYKLNITNKEENVAIIKKGAIQFLSDGYYKIYTIDGKMIKSGYSKKNEKLSLKPGIYIVNLNKTIRKVVIQ
jgi:hypothetical protein